MYMSNSPRKAFTLIEALAALAVVAIALLALIRLSLTNIRIADRSTAATQAALLAQEKMDLILAQGFPEPAAASGTLDRDNRSWQWQICVSNFALPHAHQNDYAPLRRVDVNIRWNEGSDDRNFKLTTYVTNRM